uniref:Putative serine/threonine protein kinase n=1 Tax=Pithovirus LCPAC403 TaxID=2506596 RepID=A0A481ZBJ7_9VIRU|nr:MAG: putative serine/threonine protein kinase [Pithovirus LCPAC403]
MTFVLDVKPSNDIIEGGHSTVYIGSDFVIKKPVGIEELDILVKLRHYPFVVQILGISESSFKSNELEVILEKADMDGIDFISNYNMKERKRVILQLIMALEYIHSKGIIHGDIKPSNLLWFSKLGRMKIADFGSSSMITSFRKGRYTQRYVAPDQTVGTHLDIWSMGATIFELISEENFSDKWRTSMKNTFKTTKKRKMFESDYMGKSTLVCDLLSQMLDPDPLRRITASEALNHPFFIPYKIMISENRILYPPVPCCEKKNLIFNDNRRYEAIRFLNNLYNIHSDRVIFQSLSLYDRCRECGLNDSNLIHRCVEISHSYFDGVSIKLNRAILEVLSFDIYKQTLYELCDCEKTSDSKHIFDSWSKMILDVEMTYSEIYSRMKKYL